MRKLFLVVIILIVAVSFSYGAAEDTFSGFRSGLDSPGTVAFAVTPHDTNELSYVTRGIYVGVGGDIKLTTVGGSTVTFVDVQTGTILPIRAKVIYNSVTTADSLIGIH